MMVEYLCPCFQCYRQFTPDHAKVTSTHGTNLTEYLNNFRNTFLQDNINLVNNISSKGIHFKGNCLLTMTTMRVISNMTQLDTSHVSKICGVIGRLYFSNTWLWDNNFNTISYLHAVSKFTETQLVTEQGNRLES